MNKPIHRWLMPVPAWFACSALCAMASAETLQVLQKQGPASLTAMAAKNGQVDIRLSDLLLVTLAVEGTDNLEVKAVTRTTASEFWTVRPRGPGAMIPLEKGRLGWQQTLALEPLAPGTHAVQLEPLQFREKPGAWQTVSWRPIAVKVRTEISTADPADLRDITDIETLPAPFSLWDHALGFVAAVAGLALVVVGAWLLIKRRRRPLPALSPAQWAIRELDRVLSMCLPEAGEVERFHTMLSNVVRRFLENRFELPARRQTTPEFFAALEAAPQLSDEASCLLRDFLERCDLVKFSRAQPTGPECAATAAMARKFVELDFLISTTGGVSES